MRPSGLLTYLFLDNLMLGVKIIESCFQKRGIISKHAESRVTFSTQQTSYAFTTRIPSWTTRMVMVYAQEARCWRVFTYLAHTRLLTKHLSIRLLIFKLPLPVIYCSVIFVLSSIFFSAFTNFIFLLVSITSLTFVHSFSMTSITTRFRFNFVFRKVFNRFILFTYQTFVHILVVITFSNKSIFVEGVKI